MGWRLHTSTVTAKESERYYRLVSLFFFLLQLAKSVLYQERNRHFLAQFGVNMIYANQGRIQQINLRGEGDLVLGGEYKKLDYSLVVKSINDINEWR